MAGTPGQTDTAWLVLRAQAGDRQALEELLRKAQQLLRRYIAAMTKDEHVASEVLQEVLIIIYRRIGTLREPRAFAPWARRVAARQVFRSLRANATDRRFVDELPETAAAPDAENDSADDLRERLPVLLTRISPASRAVLVMHYLEGLSIDETAAILDISVGTAKSRLSYGL